MAIEREGAGQRSRREIYLEIKAELARRGVTQASIARKLGLATGTVSNCIQGRFVSKRIIDALVESGVPKSLFDEFENQHLGLLYGKGVKKEDPAEDHEAEAAAH